MKISQYIPELIVDDIDRVTACYQSMGFTVNHIQNENMQETVVLADPSGEHLVLHQVKEWPVQVNTLIARINVTDLAAACDEIISDGGRLLTDVYENAYCRGVLAEMNGGLRAHVLQHLKK